MNSRDKNQIMILVFILAFILLTVFFILGTKDLPIWLIVVIIGIIKFIILQPSIAKMYYSVHEQEAGVSRFIPIYNELMILPPKNAMALLVSYIVLALLIGAIFLPISFTSQIVGEHIAMNLGVHIIRLCAVGLIINLAIYAVGFSKLMKDVEKVYRKFANSDNLRIFKVYHKVLLILPIVRVVTLVEIYNRLYTLTRLNNFNTNHSSVAELREE